jgi:hypothetical protein
MIKYKIFFSITILIQLHKLAKIFVLMMMMVMIMIIIKVKVLTANGLLITRNYCVCGM